jgi:class 3 adenylate cyclase
MRESAELRAVILRLLNAAAQRDGATFANMFARSPGSRYIGTDPEEWWNGVGFVEALPRHVDKWPPIHIEIGETEAFEAGEFGWGASRVITTWGDADPVPVRFSFVFTLESGIWRIAQMHSSVGVPNVDWVGVELTGSLEQLLALVEAAPASEMPVRDGTVTIVFTDIEDSTPLAAELGDVAWVEALLLHHRGIDEVVRRRGGTVVKTLGDGAMIAFTSTREAVRAAVDIQRQQADSGAAIPMGVRIGVHAGDALASDSDYLGTTVNKAARIAAVGDGGQIMVSEAVRVLLGDSNEFHFGDPLSLKLKGLDGVHEVTPVLWARVSGNG